MFNFFQAGDGCCLLLLCSLTAILQVLSCRRRRGGLLLKQAVFTLELSNAIFLVKKFVLLLTNLLSKIGVRRSQNLVLRTAVSNPCFGGFISSKSGMTKDGSTSSNCNFSSSNSARRLNSAPLRSCCRSARSSLCCEDSSRFSAAQAVRSRL